MKLNMKKILLLLSVTALMVSCNKTGESEYTISGTATGIANGQTVILEKQDAEGMGKMIPADTVKIENGKFEIKGTVSEPELYFLQVEKMNRKIPFILENGDIKVVVDKDSIHKSTVTGSYNNDELTNYNKETLKFQNKLKDFQSKNMTVMQEARAKNDTVAINKLMKEFTSLQDDVQAYSLKYAETHPKSFISVLITEGLFNTQEPDFAKIKKVYNSLTSELKNTKPGKAIKEKLDNQEAVEVGKKAPDFSAKTPEGKTVSLKESLGKVTIVDFWASWCGPCRQENPNVVALYNEFHEKGLNIVGVSLDREGEMGAWKKAIEDDKLAWTHVSNLKFWQDPIAKKYNVRSIPATFILDASGKIVAKDLRGEELKAKVKELLGA
jgi:peroxiredoxin